MKTTKRKYTPRKTKTLPYKKRQSKGITTKYSAKKKSREIKTVDLTITDNYGNAGVYVADTMTTLMFNTSLSMVQNVVRVNQGAGISQRIGNKIALKSLRLRFGIELTGNTGTPPQLARFMVIYDRQPNGTYPSAGVILSNATTAGTITNGTAYSSINPTLFDRFIVLMDKTFIIGGDVNGPTTATTEQKGFIIDEFIKLKGLETCFSGNTAGSPIADIQTGALYIVGLGDQTANTEAFFMAGMMRLRYYDN